MKKTLIVGGLLIAGVVLLASRKKTATTSQGNSNANPGTSTGTGNTAPGMATNPIVPAKNETVQPVKTSQPQAISHTTNGVTTVFAVGDIVVYGGTKYKISAIYSKDMVELAGINDSSRLTMYPGYLKKA